jgi:phospholipid/cholesterol/gamma-HCH transport system substrate-binding protein
MALGISSGRISTDRRPALNAAIILLTVLVVAVWIVVLAGGRGGYTVRVVLPEATGLYDGSPMQINGVDAGSIESVVTRGDNAIATVRVDSTHAPLHAGASVTVDYRSVLGERYVKIQPGPPGNPALPSGSLVEAGSSQVTVEDLLEAFDPATRATVRSLVPELAQTLGGKEQDLNATVEQAGPSIEALGQVLGAVGQDGPAIHELVGNLRKVVDVLAQRRGQLSSSLANLSTVTTSVAAKQRQIADSVGQLPATLRQASHTLGQFVPTADTVVPLLDQLRPGVARLPSVAANLRPVLGDLRPAVGDLRPLLEDGYDLFGHTPAFLDAGTGESGAVRQLTTTVHQLDGPIAFLRPYTPELMGFFTNWRTVFGDYDSQGHFVRAYLRNSANSIHGLPTPVPGSSNNVMPPPGSIVHEPWTDADGDGMH